MVIFICMVLFQVITVNLIKAAMEKCLEKGARLFLVDGFPRDEQNVAGWNEVMDGFAVVKLVLYFDCPEPVMEARLLERGKTSGRSDDNLESIRKRFKTYVASTTPIIEGFAAKGLVCRIIADRSVDEVFQEAHTAVKQILDQNAV